MSRRDTLLVIVGALGLVVAWLTWRPSDDDGAPRYTAAPRAPDTARAPNPGDTTHRATDRLDSQVVDGPGSVLPPTCDTPPVTAVMAAAEAEVAIYERDVERIVDGLRSSRDLDGRLLRVVLQDRHPASERAEALQDLQRLAPGATHIAHLRYQLCDALGDHPACRDAETVLTAIDGDNGISWLRVFGRYASRGDWRQARIALARAADAPRFDLLSAAWVDTSEQALRALGQRSELDRMMFGMGIAAGVAIVDFGVLSRACRPGAQPNDAWPDICHATGSAMSSRGTNVLTRLIGLSVMQPPPAGTSALPGQASANEQAGALQELLGQSRAWNLDRYLALEAGNTARYLNDWRIHGEAYAMQSALDAAMEAYIQGNYSPCSE